MAIPYLTLLKDIRLDSGYSGQGHPPPLTVAGIIHLILATLHMVVHMVVMNMPGAAQNQIAYQSAC